MRDKLDVLFWAAIKPMKLGSFEDYLINLSKIYGSQDHNIKIVLEKPIAPEVEDKFSELNIDYELVDASQLQNGFYLVRYLYRTKPKILHLHFFGAGDFILLWARLFLNIKIIFHDHNSRPVLASTQKNTLKQGGTLQVLKRRIFSHFINHFIVVSNFIAKANVQELPIPPDKISVIYNGVDIHRFRPADMDEKSVLTEEIFGQIINKPIFTFVGTLNENKGIDIFLKTIQQLNNEEVDAFYAIIGDGPLRRQVEETVNKLGPENAAYLGLRSDVNLILRASDAFIAPYKWEEAFGLTLIEASSSGLPTIASNVGAMKEIIGENEIGFSIEPGDSKALCESIKQLVTNKGLRHELGRQARLKVENLYSIEKMVDHTIDLYQKLA